MAERSFGRRVLAELADPYGDRHNAQALAAENERLRAELDRVRAWGERYRDRHDERAKELSAERAKLMKIATVKCWTNEDGRRFVFVTDLQAALGVLRDDAEEVDRG